MAHGVDRRNSNDKFGILTPRESESGTISYETESDNILSIVFGLIE